MRFFTERRQLLDAAREISRAGLTRGTSGNLSIRIKNWFLITPTGVSYEELTTDDLVEMNLEGKVPFGQSLPSSEWRLHQRIYASRPDLEAIVHTHSMFCTTLSCLRRSIPAVHYMIAVTGQSTIPCAEYGTFGTEELARQTQLALAQGKACLLANHGMVASGGSLAEALKIAHSVEELAELYWRALQVGQPVIIDQPEIERVIGRFKTYGQAKPRRSA
jgi:L-fuculose-phosphate aldolase